jgi:glyoxylase-like metal-dependent hydrolase (beta-lactamase superfamily II)
MPAPMLKVGSILVIPLSDGGFAMPADAFMPSVSAEQWEPVKEYLNPDRTIPLNFGAFLIREGESWTLVDTGFGSREGSPGGKLLGELEKAKLQPGDISRVIITHLHPDHIGWNTVDRDGRPEVLFKNARHVVQRKDWEYFLQAEVKGEAPHIGLCAEPLEPAGVLDLIDGDSSISAGISAILTPGHTPGHQSILISSGEEKAIIVGDVTHTPAQVVNPDWSPVFDVDGELSAKTRKALWERIEQQGLKVAAGHYAYPSIGSFVRVEGKRRWQPVS